MAATTPRFGLNWFDTNTEGDFSDDSQKFTGEDRLLIDSVLAALEKHDHHLVSALDAPTGAPDVQASLGGALEGGTEYYYVVSFLTTDGLETVTGDEVSVTTPDILAVSDPPSAETGDALAYPASQLTEGVYYYAVTGLRTGEESALSDFDIATVLDDENTVILTLPDLGDATAFQVWRMKESGAQWTRIGVTSDPTFIDDGSVPAALYGDPDNTPPEDAEGTDNYLVTITLTGDDLTRVQSGDVAGWRIYRTTISGTYSAASLVHEVIERTSDTNPTSPLVTSWIDDGDEPFTGSPRTTSTQLAVTPYTFEKATTLPATAAYPANYPLLVGDTLYYNKAGTWTALSGGGSGGGSGGSINYEGAWVSGTYDPGTLVTYNNTLWLSNSAATTVPGSQAGGQPLTISTNGQTYGQAVNPTTSGYPIQAAGQKFRNDGAMDVTSVQLYFDGTQTVGATFVVAFGFDNVIAHLNTTAAYNGTVPSGTGYKSFPLAAPFHLPANTDVWLYAGSQDAKGLGLCLQGAQSSGITFTGASYSRQPSGYTTLIEDPVNDGGKMLVFRLVGTDALINQWDRLASIIPAAVSTGQVLTSTGTGTGAYAWAEADTGDSGDGGAAPAVTTQYILNEISESDTGQQFVIFTGVSIAPGEVWELDAKMHYRQVGQPTFLITPSLDNPGNNGAINFLGDEGALWYDVSSVKFVTGSGLIGNSIADAGPAVTVVTENFGYPLNYRILAGNNGSGPLTLGLNFYMAPTASTVSLTIAAGSYLRATRLQSAF